jgi:hypothetical protein
MPIVNQYSKLQPCRNCGYEVRYVRNIENAATPVNANWVCPNCGTRVPGVQVASFVQYEMSTPDKATPNMPQQWIYATPDSGGYDGEVKASF